MVAMRSFWNSLESHLPFTDRALEILLLAVDEAILANHGSIGPEHILLAILRGSQGVAAMVLQDHGVEIAVVRRKIREIGTQAGQQSFGNLETRAAEASVKQAIAEASKLGCDYVGTEHFLLAMFCDQQTVAAQVLLSFGLTYEKTRNALWQYLKHCWHGYSPTSDASGETAEPPRPRGDTGNF
jgi:ATP-dependent Clp protease ATP-binding subunit ClpC